MKYPTLAVLLTLAGGCNSTVLPFTPAARTIAACNSGVSKMEALGCFSQQEIDDRQAVCDALVDQYAAADDPTCDFTAVFGCIEDHLDCDTGVQITLCLLELDPDDVERCPEFFNIQP